MKNIDKWDELANYLKEVSKEVSHDDIDEVIVDRSIFFRHGDTDDCVYAYITESGGLIDICYPDYFQGWGSEDRKMHGEYAAVMLPWIGKGEDLKKEIESEIFYN